MGRHFVSGFPRALLSLSQEKSSGVEILFCRTTFVGLKQVRGGCSQAVVSFFIISVDSVHFSTYLAYVAGVRTGREMGNRWENEEGARGAFSLARPPRSPAGSPFPFPSERLPRTLLPAWCCWFLTLAKKKPWQHTLTPCFTCVCAEVCIV